MRLIDALRLDVSARLALVGAGGKSTALFQLGRQALQVFPGVSSAAPKNELQTVLVTASTHLAIEQAGLADHHFILTSTDDLARLVDNLPCGLALLTGPAGDEERFQGLAQPLMDGVASLADQLNSPLFIEADGSRRLPLKAPASHEPVIPPWANTVVVVAGLSGVGQPLTPAWVHRPERFARLAGIALEEPVSITALERVLASPDGGLKGIPPSARRVALLNQADSASRQALAKRLAARLLGAYQAVLVAALTPPATTDGSLAERGVFAVHEPAAGILLAAGGASRLGQPKQILEWRGEPLVRHAARSGLAAGLDPLVVVTGHAAQVVQEALSGLPVKIVYNPDWGAGQSTSVIAGLRAAQPECGAAIFLLADQPLVPTALVRGLVDIHAASLAPIVAPLVDGQRANPVLFDRATFPDLLSLSGDSGGRALFSRYPVTWLPWHDPLAALDVDTLADYERLLELRKTESE